MFKPLDAVLHSELRLAIISLLVGVKQADFGFLKEKTSSTSGNLSVQLQKLSHAGYIAIEKSFKGNYPLTTCKITEEGMLAFENYVKAIRSYIETGER
jgi:DNA-binding transcriptional ArsR family regulator